MSFRRIPLGLGALAVLALAGAGGAVMAQKTGDDASTAFDSVATFEVTGVEVDVRGKDANAARMGGWRLAQRKGWEMLSRRMTGHGSTLSDSALDALVAGIVVEQEQIGPTRYIARLGIQFDRARAAGLLGVSGAVTRSPSMLLVPVEWSGGTGRVFERQTEWAQAWARFHASGSTIDYVRPRGNGPDAMLIDAGQESRRGRGWWRQILDQYGANDILIAEVELHHDFPGGPVIARFTASHGPDRTRITQFSLRLDNGEGIDALMDQGVARIDKAFQDALSAGQLDPDKLLAYRPPAPKPTATPTGTPTPEATPSAEATATTAATTTFAIQVDTPSAASVTASEAAVRGVPGVRSAVTTSLALGGISVMRVSYDGPIGSLRAALEGRGWSVQEGTGVLRIRRPGGGGATPAPSGGRATPAPAGGRTAPIPAPGGATGG